MLKYICNTYYKKIYIKKAMLCNMKWRKAPIKIIEKRYTQPMGIFERLGDVLKSYLNDQDDTIFSSRSFRQDRRDPDLDAAFEELDEFLGKKEREAHFDARAAREEESFERAWRQNNSEQTGRSSQRERPIPESLSQDFAELGLPLGASAEECKAAYKRLLKLHHPDRHAGHPGNMQKATAKTARINAAFDRIAAWRETGRVE